MKINLYDDFKRGNGLILSSRDIILNKIKSNQTKLIRPRYTLRKSQETTGNHCAIKDLKKTNCTIF